MFTLEKVPINTTTTNFTQVLLCVMLSFKSMSEKVMGRKMVLFGTNELFVFTSVYNGITTQIKHDVASFFAPIHYVTHMTNLAMKILSTQSLVDKLINSLQGIFFFKKNW
jgi:hypothetical protein